MDQAKIDTWMIELQDVSTELESAYTDESEQWHAEWNSKILGWFHADDERLEARRFIADYQALTPALERIKIRGEIRKLEERRDMLKFLITTEMQRA